MLSPVDFERTPATEPDSTPVSTEQHRGMAAVSCGAAGERSCRMPPPLCGRHDDDHPSVAKASKPVGRGFSGWTERTSEGFLATAPCEAELSTAPSLSAEDHSRLTSSCSAASRSCSAASSSAACLQWAATSNRHHRCSMTHMHTAAATTTTAAADHQYAIIAARTGTPTLARIGCRSAHDGGCMYSR
jgi:hypothetical protein